MNEHIQMQWVGEILLIETQCQGDWGAVCVSLQGAQRLLEMLAQKLGREVSASAAPIHSTTKV